MSNRSKYRAFCKTQSDLTVFDQDWWLDLTCGKDQWDVILVEKGGQIVGALPFYLKRKFPLIKSIEMPPLTQTLGLYIQYPHNQSFYKRQSFEKDVIEEMINSIPKFSSFQHRINFRLTNWLPFYWNGFEQTSRYSYILDDLEELDIDGLITSSRKRRIKKAQKLGVEVLSPDNSKVEKFISLVNLTYERRGITLPYEENLIREIYTNGIKLNSVVLYVAEFEDKIIAGGLFLKDKSSIYYLIGGIDHKYGDVGAMDMVLRQGILLAKEEGKIFDFEGSMDESIGRYFRSFGAKPRTYFTISKTTSKYLVLISAIKNLIR